MSFERKATFEICGAVVRKPFVSQSGKFAKVVLATPGRSGEKKTAVRAFDAQIIEDIGSLGVGQTVRITGDIDPEKLTAKDKSDVTVDGYAVWCTVLTARWLQVEGSSRAAAPTPNTPTARTSAKPKSLDEADVPSDEDIPF